MNELLNKFLDFKTLNNYRFEYLLENDDTIIFRIHMTQFPHLIGLQKLKDFHVISRFNDKGDKAMNSKRILSLIKKEKILTSENIKKSIYFNKIRERYNFLSRESILSLSFNEVIINFDKNKLVTSLKSDYIFVEKRENGFLHLGIKKVKDEYIPETFFFQNDDYYQRNQIILKIKKIKIFDSKGNVVLIQDL